MLSRVKLTSLLKRFRRNQRGTVALLAAAAAIPMLAAAGAALDMIRATNVQAQLQNALDNGALAAAASRTLTPSQRVKIAEATFAKNWPDPMNRDMTVLPKFQVNGDTVTGTATVTVPTTIMRVVGIQSMDINGEVNVSIPQGKKAEIVLVLDYSGSMKETSGGQVKWVAMKDAAKKLVTDLQTMGSNRVMFGLVPFSHHVWVTLPKKFVRGQSGVGSWTGCTQDRPYPANLTDDTPTNADATKWGWPHAPTAHGGCGAYVPNSLTVLPLTNDFADITAQLDAMRPYAYTHIALGAEFGWHLLSPNAPFTEGANYGDKGTDKVLVILTDGRQTEPAFGPGATRDVRQGEKNLEALCGNIKSEGVIVMTIAFDLRDDDTKTRLKNCATDPDKNFFDADTGADVAVAFESIKSQVAQIAYLSK